MYYIKKIKAMDKKILSKKTVGLIKIKKKFMDLEKFIKIT